MRIKGMPLVPQGSAQMMGQTLQGMEYYMGAKEGYKSQNP
jgi:hypothetical protein